MSLFPASMFANSGNSSGGGGGGMAQAGAMNMIGEGLNQDKAENTKQLIQRSGNIDASQFTEEDLAALRAIIGGESSTLAARRDKYSKQAAMADSMGLVNSLSRQLSEQLIPQLGANFTGGGALNSTSQRFLANDLIARTAEQAAALQLDTVGKYANIEMQQIAPLIELFNTLKGGKTSQREDGRQFVENEGAWARAGKNIFGFGGNVGPEKLNF